MEIRLLEINQANYQECIDLKVTKEQEKFVATNIFSLVQAAYEPELYPLGIYSKDKMVGFILYDFDQKLNGWSMSRFMIDEKYQNQGIGKLALQKFIELFINKYGGQVLYTSAEVDNPIAIRLYEEFGFKKEEIFEYEFKGVTYKEVRMVLNK